MFNNHDVRDTTGLGALFRSHHFGRAVRGVTASGSAPRGSAEDETVSGSHGAARPSDRASGSSGHADDGSARPSRASSAPPHHGFRAAALVSGVAAAALVVAGVISGAGRHPHRMVSAQAEHSTGGSHGPRPSAGGAARTVGIGGSRGSAAPGSVAPVTVRTVGGFGAGSTPGGHVDLGGAATTTGGAVPAVPTPPTPARGSPASPAGSPAGSAGTRGGNTVNAVVALVTGDAGQLGATVPGAASTADALGNAVSGVGQSLASASP
jgi:hypothetical protein